MENSGTVRCLLGFRTRLGLIRPFSHSWNSFSSPIPKEEEGSKGSCPGSVLSIEYSKSFLGSGAEPDGDVIPGALGDVNGSKGLRRLQAGMENPWKNHGESQEINPGH